MSRPRENIIEYRSYDLSEEMPLEVHQRRTWQISPVRSSRLHIHNCFEIGVCLSGSGTISFGQEEFPYREGDALFVGRNVPHTTWSSPETGSVWKYIHADPELVLGEAALARASAPQKFIWMFSDCHMLLPSSECTWLDPLASAIVEEASGRQQDYLACLQGLFETLFFRLFRLYSTGAGQSESPVQLSALAPALDYISRHYMENFPQETLAALCHLSPTHFRRKFQQQLGTNPLSYLHQVRILKSCSLLRSSNLSIAEIAEETGYTSLSCFNRHFMELNGCTPSRWRNLSDEARRTTLIGLPGWDRPETADEIQARNRTDARSAAPAVPAAPVAGSEESEAISATPEEA